MRMVWLCDQGRRLLLSEMLVAPRRQFAFEMDDARSAGVKSNGTELRDDESGHQRSSVAAVNAVRLTVPGRAR
jgi:hypothetical protein